jgi:TRAP transporter TAXI family solute receptor
MRRILPLARVATAALVPLVLGMGGCQSRREEPPRQALRIMSGPSDQAARELAAYFTSSIPTIAPVVKVTPGSSFVMAALHGGEGDIGFAQADVVYGAYRRGNQLDPRPQTNVRGIAVLWVSTLYIIVRSDDPYRSVEELRGRRVGIDEQGTSAESFSRVVLEAHGLTYADLQPHFMPFQALLPAVQAGKIDAAFMPSPLVDSQSGLRGSEGLRLLPIEQKVINQLRGLRPFIKPVVVPAGEFTGNHRDVQTVGSDGLLICRENLGEDLVYELTKAFFSALPTLSPPASSVDPDQAPATPIPLHPGAARYYREREVLH